MDRITNGFLNDFVSNYGFENVSVPEQFEYFSDYCSIANESGSVDIELQDMHTGSSAQGIDGIAIEVNGRYVNSTKEIDDLINYNKTLTVTFVLIQAKTSEEFNNTLISNFLAFVQTFFTGNSSVFCTDEMKHFIELKDYIYSKSANMKIRNPNLHLYYISCGVWNKEDATLDAVIKQNIDFLRKSNLFEEVDFIPFGSKELQRAYRKSTSNIEVSFVFDRRVTMFSNGEDNIAYCGVLPYSEFRKIISSEQGYLMDVFEDNIRDFLGNDNDVNAAIENTLQNSLLDKFSVLNNGITVVADKIALTGDKVTMTNYQIVNGCQTSHVLFSNEKIEGINSLMIPIRLIATTDEELKNDITRATNNQTSIKKEQLEALSTFQRTLEEYYKTFIEPNTVLYYERRTGQYRGKGVPQTQIISIPMQIKAASSMFLDNPHGVSGQYGTIVKNVGKRLFKENDKPILYYVSALGVYRYENFIRQKKIENKYRRARYHVLMLFKYVVAGQLMPKYFNSKKMENYCQKILDVLNDESRCLYVFDMILQYMDKIDSIKYSDRKVFERKETTDMLLSKIDDICNFINEV